jgi:hypothetical protein
MKKRQRQKEERKHASEKTSLEIEQTASEKENEHPTFFETSGSELGEEYK